MVSHDIEKKHRKKSAKKKSLAKRKENQEPFMAYGKSKETLSFKTLKIILVSLPAT